ncbi:hypothetical protein FC55_GL000534 [Ligilactobacillus salivarius DSM 20555 = ATCC 11741]|nr:hypothetical protein FC55_GL000534 [Ligilactobacillus salivarius DSM 20555 = ATCC 11741]
MSTGVFHSYVVPLGKSFSLAIPCFASGVLPFSTVTSFPCGANRTKSLPGIVCVDLSGYVIVAVPSFSTVTAVLSGSGNTSLFASFTLFSTSRFSLSVNSDTFATGVFSGMTTTGTSAVNSPVLTPSTLVIIEGSDTVTLIGPFAPLVET